MLDADQPRIVLIPYWIPVEPEMLDFTDHSWWFQALQRNDILIFAGPYIRTKEIVRNEYCSYIKIKTTGLEFSITDIENDLRDFNIKLWNITLMWHVLEASATCRVNDLQFLTNATKIAVIADTHHLKNPISTLIKVINNESYNLICCTHNQYEPFFAISCNLEVISFPYINPYEELDLHKSKPTNWELKYYGNILSPTHIFRNIYVNEALRSTNISLMPRMNMKDWTNCLTKNPGIVLTCSLNGSFSFQTLYPILAGNILVTDPISKSSWIHDFIHSSNSCFTYKTRKGCKSLLKELPSYANQAKPKIRNEITKASEYFASKLLNKFQLMRAYRNIEENLDSLKNLSSDESRHLTVILRELKGSRGNSALEKAIEVFEHLQEIHRKYWNLIMISEAKKRIHIDKNPIDDYILQLTEILPRAILLTRDELLEYKLNKPKKFDVYIIDLDLLFKNI